MSTQKTNQTSQDQTSDEEKAKLMFDEELHDIFREACQQAFLRVPELRSVVVTYDFYRNLNDVEGVSTGLWLHADGAATKPADSITGSLGVVLQSAAHILDEQMQLYANLTTQLTEVSKELHRKRQQLDKEGKENV